MAGVDSDILVRDVSVPGLISAGSGATMQRLARVRPAQQLIANSKSDSMNHPPRYTGPLLTLEVHEQLLAGLRAEAAEIECSLDLGRSNDRVQLQADHWLHDGQAFPYPPSCKERTIYYWDGERFSAVSRYADSLIKLVPTQWGAPTFEIDGIKMLPTLHVSPYEDARQKVALIAPRDKQILDTCGGLGYFAAWCLDGGAARIVSFEKNASVLWLRQLNPWSPDSNASRLELQQGDVFERIATLPDAAFDAALHDPPRFGIAGELYSQTFYDHLFRVLKRRGKLFHYTGTPNKLTTGRDVPNEVSQRLRRAGFDTTLSGDGVLAVKRR
jgi:predicted methyltransferase